MVAVSRGHSDQGDTSLWSPQGVSGLQKAMGVTATKPLTGWCHTTHTHPRAHSDRQHFHWRLWKVKLASPQFSYKMWLAVMILIDLVSFVVCTVCWLVRMEYNVLVSTSSAFLLHSDRPYVALHWNNTQGWTDCDVLFCLWCRYKEEMTMCLKLI